MDDAYRIRAELNGGYLHRAHILELGGTDALIATAITIGWLTRIRVGTYAFTDTYAPLSPAAKHGVLARATIDKFPHGSVALSGHSAAAAHGMDLYDVDLDTVHLVRLDGGSGRVESGVVHHDARPSDDALVTIDGRLLVTPRHAMWEVACRGSRRAGLVVMDSALHHGLVTPEELADQDREFHRWPRSRAARLVARLADPGAESPAETLFRFICFEHHLPRPTTQFEIFDASGGFLARTDLGWEGFRLVWEVDGLRKYLRDLRPGENASDVVIREKIREDAIRARLYGVGRSIWDEVQPDHSLRTSQRVRFKLDESHRLYAKGRVHLA